MTHSSLNPLFYIEQWQVDTSSNRIVQADKEVKLQSKVMEVLVYLASHADELVSREQLEQAVWGDSVVGYDALTRCIAQLRKSLGDDPQQPRFIETISKKGYRFIAQVSNDPVQTESSSPTPRQTNKYRLLNTLGLVLIPLLLFSAYFFQAQDSHNPENTAKNKSSIIIVIPFQTLGNIEKQSYFSDGITADIITALSKLDAIHVVAGNKAAAIKSKPKSSDVVYTLSGSVRRADERIRMNVNLIDSKTGTILWSEKYDRTIQSLFELQDEVVDKIINALSVTLSEAEKLRIAKRYTDDVQAYDDFLQGQSYYKRFTGEDNKLARSYYQRAIERDEKFARVWGSLALTYLAEYRYSWTSEKQLLEKAQQYAQKAIALDGQLPETLWTSSMVNLFSHNYVEAEKAARRVIELDNYYADSYIILAYCRLNEKNTQEALALTRKAMLLNPDYSSPYVALMGQAFYFNNQPDLAVDYLRDALSRNNSMIHAHIFYIASLSRMNKAEEANWAVQEFRSAQSKVNINNFAQSLGVNNPEMIEQVRNDLINAGF